jgi:hypothetical protein
VALKNKGSGSFAATCGSALAASTSTIDARQAGATEQQLRDITAEGLAEMHFRDAGRRAPGLLVEFTDGP